MIEQTQLEYIALRYLFERFQIDEIVQALAEIAKEKQAQTHEAFKPSFDHIISTLERANRELKEMVAYVPRETAT